MKKLNSALFLDRDGVINQRIVGDYVRHLPQLK
jgi:histidinol phosphatase-like enzyme